MKFVQKPTSMGRSPRRLRRHVRQPHSNRRDELGRRVRELAAENPRGSGPSAPPRPVGAEYRRVGSVLVVIGGLPATGKSTIATALAGRTALPYVRVDRIEQAIVAWSLLPIRSDQSDMPSPTRLPRSSCSSAWTSSWSVSILSRSPATAGWIWRQQPALCRSRSR